jgi:UDPglucose 6-dehydrogenase
MQKIGIIGQGFVGSAVYEGMKNHFDVLAYDKDPNKFSNVSCIQEIVQNVDVTFLCVPTPMRSTGECDLRILTAALEELRVCVGFENKSLVVVIKSTIPPGTTETLNKEYSQLHLVFNPEFLTEANAIEDYKNQNRIIIGGEQHDVTTVKRIFSKAFPQVPIIETNSTIAETIKYVTNIFLATKVSFANEMYQLCEGLGIDYNTVIDYAKYDNRLGNTHWAVPGPDGDFGYGGHCFPKDIAALQHLMLQLNIDSTIIDSVIQKNKLARTNLDWEQQIGRAVSTD